MARKLYALLVGINDYPHVRPLKGCVNDALSVKAYLDRQTHWEKDIQILLGKEQTDENTPTKARLVEAIRSHLGKAKDGDVALLFFAGHSVFGQRSDLTRKNNKVKNYTTHKFRKNKKFAEICPIFIASEYPYQSIGVKIGDPLALTYKFYASNTFAFGIDIGKASEGLYSQLHSDRFNSIRMCTD